MITVVSHWVVRSAAWLAPRAARAAWRREWLSETWHYAALLEERGLGPREIRARLWRHCMGAYTDAWHLRAEAPGLERVQAALRKPGFCLALIALSLAVIVTGSRGLVKTRAMLQPHYDDAGRLVLISESGIMMGERIAVSPRLLEYWKRHSTTFAGLAGYRWDQQGTAWVTPDFFDVLGRQPRRFLLREIHTWKKADGQAPLGVVGRLLPGVSAAAAQNELRDLADDYRFHLKSFPFPQAEVTPLLARIRQPLYSYAALCAGTIGLLLAAACLGVIADLRRSRRIRRRYWAYFCVKSAGAPLALALAIWEFSGATSITLTGGTTFLAEPFLTWLFIVACGGTIWWCLADQKARCRRCLQRLQFPVRIGSPGAVLFDHAGTELVCCEGHGTLYLPELSSDYVQGESWTALDSETSESAVPR
jgi:hypothetical protein